jgi:hypothetical protein
MKWLTLVLALVVALFVLNCGSDSMHCEDGTTCATTGEVWKACCTESSSPQCEYRAGSHTFECDGYDCQAAAIELNNYCNPT